MIIISHRGNLTGPDFAQENHPDIIDIALSNGFDVEVDVRVIDSKFFLGHDLSQYEIPLNWFEQRSQKLWIHCKNVEAILLLKDSGLHYFWHDSDILTLTSKNILWAYPCEVGIKGSISVLPELKNTDLRDVYGVCTDYPFKYSK
jgi:hypothetical protein